MSLIQNVGARGYWVRDVNDVSTLLAPGDILEVTEARADAMVKAATHVKRHTLTKAVLGAVQEIVKIASADAPAPMPPAPPAPTLADLPEETAIALIDKADPGNLSKLAENEKRPAVLSAIAKRTRR